MTRPVDTLVLMQRLIAFVLMLLGTAGLARAQSIAGTVSDPSAAPVAHATVIVSSERGDPARVATTDAAGGFSIEWTQPGAVSILVSRPGFAEYRTQRVIGTAPVRVDVRLAVSSFAEDVRVAADLAETAAVSSRLGLARRETPASVDVVTQEVIQARGADTASTALRYVTGLTSSLRPGASAVFSSRGFTENSLGVLFNGLRVQSSTITMRNYDAFNFDRVEVVRGPASVLHGEGTAVGAINFVRREAAPGRTRVEGLLDLGDGDRFRIGGAAAGSAGGRSSYSVSFARNQFGTHVSGNQHEYNHLAAALRTTVGALSLGAEGDWLLNDVDDAYWGTPLVDNAIDDTLYGRNYNRSANNRYHDAVGWGRITAAAPISRRLAYNGQIYVYGAARDWRNSYGFEFLPSTGQVLRRAVETLAYDHELWGTRHELSTDFQLGDRPARAVAGLDFSRTTFSSPRSYGVRVAVDAQDAASLDFNAPERLDDRRASLDQRALFGEFRIQIIERLTALAGGRIGTVDNAVARPVSGVRFEQNFSPRDGRIGVVFASTPSISLYGQYATGSEPVEALLILGPAESSFSLAHVRSVEGGVKASVAGGRIDFTAAGYHLRKRNLLTADPDNPSRAIQVGRQSSRGLELSLTARPNSSWLFDANLAVLDARYDSFNEGGTPRDGITPPNVPEIVLNVAGTWRPIARAEVGLWLSRVGERTADTTGVVVMPSYTTIDPFVCIAMRRDLDLTVRVRNATNERYVEWATRAFGVTNVYFGEPRRFIVSLRARF